MLARFQQLMAGNPIVGIEDTLNGRSTGRSRGPPMSNGKVTQDQHLVHVVHLQFHLILSGHRGCCYVFTVGGQRVPASKRANASCTRTKKKDVSTSIQPPATSSVPSWF